RKTGKSLLLYAIPLLAGLAITHTFIPPTPGPVAVAEVLNVNLGWVILTGALVGLPTLVVCGIWFGRYISKKIHITAPQLTETKEETHHNLPPIGLILMIIITPIALILLSTFMNSGILNMEGLSIGYRRFSFDLASLVTLTGHPFTALIIANLMAWYLLGKRQGLSKEQLFEITTRSMAPAGTIILLTGAGGVFKQVLVDTAAGEMIASLLTQTGMPIIVFAFLVASLIRIIQGSATVAMLTAAGIVSPLLDNDLGQFATSCIAIAIASGASVLSHVNDSGFWLVGQYLDMTEKQTASSWTVMTTLLAFCGFLSSWLLMSLFA
ncbi:MAG: gluconate transporter, partial [Cyclobacteriaceae bacterium]